MKTLFKKLFGDKKYFLVNQFKISETTCYERFVPIGGVECCVRCEYNKKYNPKERWVRCSK